MRAVADLRFTSLFSAWGDDFDSRTSYLTTTETHYNVGFRIDFILYSCMPIIIGYIYQNRLHYRNEFYSLIHNTYIIANAFWVLVIRANFSDRFAYLSWFMYALVMMYPLLESPDSFNNVRQKIFWTLFGINLFTYFMYWR
jgi:predicted Na+-dependent transporter